VTDVSSECACVIDTNGLYDLATASGNLKTILLDQLKKGVIAVPSCAWQEFEDLYDEEAAEIKPYVTSRIIMKKAYYVGAARLADKLNSGFSRGAYDNHTEFYTASIATTNAYRILTSAAQVPVYDGMGCDVSDLETWVEELDSGE
jgi:hypothetical protein